MRWITGATPRPEPPPSAPSRATSERGSVHDTLLSLPKPLDGSGLPNGVIELLIEDSKAALRRLLDIHDGRVTIVEPGRCVPWASIAGPTPAWAMALGPERNTSALRLTGDKPLAERVLAALPRHD